ncbi:MAG: hypothetical protein BWY43_00438 [candidate division WS2 bacterium ADurb.Bin280]|uniref:Uncharacterized protein n=1 Tax=candidate division WS2 bacterium ADurb.Bin280 TaxID=1852829 RepID=A0A1V5SDK5_9BACT|nr:MAG: hypothetical protein BWY43_00438 [candidate division WS2 bacterium ADurb.Bin280]
MKITNFFIFLLPAFLFAIFYPNIALASKTGLVVKKSDGQIKTACVEFEQETISGMSILKKSPFTIIEKNGFVVSIDQEGEKESHQMSSGDFFWSYWKKDGAWSFQNIGVNYSNVKNGDVEGWIFGDGSSSLPNIKFSDICFEQEEAVVLSATEQGDDVRVSESEKGSFSSDVKQGTAQNNSGDTEKILPRENEATTSEDLPEENKDQDNPRAQKNVSSQDTTFENDLVPQFNLKNLLFVSVLVFSLILILVFFKILSSRRKRNNRVKQSKG